LRHATLKVRFGIALAGLIVSLWLVYTELRRPGFCPRILTLPACYLVFCSFGLVMFSAVASSRARRAALFFPAAIAGLVLAIRFSIRQFTGTARCPHIMGLPLCYLSLATFATLLVLGAIDAKRGKVEGQGVGGKDCEG
jgi:hypothetical protein